MRARVSLVSESPVRVRDGDDGGAQLEQGGEEVGHQGGQRTQEYHTLQEGEKDAHACLFDTHVGNFTCTHVTTTLKW